MAGPAAKPIVVNSAKNPRIRPSRRRPSDSPRSPIWHKVRLPYQAEHDDKYRDRREVRGADAELAMPAEDVKKTAVSIRRPPKLSARYQTAKLPIALNTNITANNPAALVGEYPIMPREVRNQMDSDADVGSREQKHSRNCNHPE